MELIANLSIHGTPYGQDFDGEASDAKYCESLYDGKADVAKMVIETVNTLAGSVCHYTYKVSKQVSDVKSRAGGYIALTLTLNQMCTKPKTIYNILRSVFETSVVGTFITPVTNGYRHSVGHYSDLPKILEAMRNNCFGLLGSLCEGDESIMAPIPAGARNGTIKTNPYDVSDEDLFKASQTYRSVEVSTEFPLRIETEIQQRIQAEVVKAEKTIKTTYEDNITSLNQEIHDLQKSISQGDGNNREFHNLRTKIQQLQTSNAQLMDEISRRRGREPEPIQQPRTNNNTRILLLSISAIVIFVIILFVIFAKDKQPMPKISELENIEVKVDALLAKVNKLVPDEEVSVVEEAPVAAEEAVASEETFEYYTHNISTGTVTVSFPGRQNGFKLGPNNLTLKRKGNFPDINLEYINIKLGLNIPEYQATITSKDKRNWILNVTDSTLTTINVHCYVNNTDIGVIRTLNKQ